MDKRTYKKVQKILKVELKIHLDDISVGINIIIIKIEPKLIPTPYYNYNK